MKFSYDELMLSCLKLNNYDKRTSIDSFMSDFRVREQLKGNASYARVVYERVIKKQNLVAEGRSELVSSLRRALEALESKAHMTGDWVTYMAFTEKYAKILGMDKEVNLNLTQINTMPNVEELLERISSNESRIRAAIGGLPERSSATGDDKEAGPCITIPTEREAEVSS